MIRKKTATKACKAQAPTSERLKVFIYGQKKNEKEKKKSRPPCLYKNVKYDSKVKEAHFKTVKNHSDIDSRTNTLHKMFFSTHHL